MFSILRNAFTVKEIRTKILYMLLVLFLIRIGTHLPIPGLDINQLANSDNQNTLYSLITGGNYGTIFAMGIGPYINASIIMQLLTVAIPKLEQIQKDGEEGRKKILDTLLLFWLYFRVQVRFILYILRLQILIG